MRSLLEWLFVAACLAFAFSAGMFIEKGMMTHAVISVPGPSEAETARIAAETEAWKALTAELKTLATQQRLAPAIEAREWLTLDEAAEYSGLSVATLTDLLKSEKPPLVFAGRGPKTWRIQRASLDAYGKAARQ